MMYQQPSHHHPTLARPGSLACSDWLDFARNLPPTSVDLLYADPPFNTGKRRDSPPAGAALGRAAGATYDDAWPTIPDWLAWLRERLQATLPALKPSASILLHIDWRTCHHARLLLDELLGPDRFVNHLIWQYGLGGSSPRRFARKHDDILFYCLDPDRYWFQPPRVPATSNRMRGQLKKAGDILDIPALNNMAAERTGYPTQKPLALLDLLIRACCPREGLVIDPCCGSGTTLVAAVRAGRRAAGADSNPQAVAIVRDRLAEAARQPAPTGSAPAAPSAR